MKRNIALLIGIVAGGFWSLSAQEDNDIGTETVDVVRPYSPTVSDAFKIRTLPQINDSIVLQKKDIEYKIYSVPVASTFTPAKGKAAQVERARPEKLYNSYASFALGNFNNTQADFYSSRDIYRGNERLDFGLNHRSSRGDIDNTPLDTDFYNTRLNSSYSNRNSDRSWGADIALKHQLYNWYGLPEGTFDETTIATMDERQQYYTAEAGAYLDQEDSFFEGGKLRYRRFWDAVESGENRAILSPSFGIPVNDETFQIGLNLDYVNGNFTNANAENIQNTPEITYGLLQAGLRPGLLIESEGLSVRLGANLVYGLDTETEASNFYIYPQVTASYELAEESAIAYVGVEGGLDQNSYYDFVQDNPYVSPTLLIQPTDRQYDAYVGLKGQLASSVSYNIRGSYKAENRRPLFLLNPENTFRNDEKAYYYGNSFGIFYDDIKTLGIFGELNVSINRNFSLGVNATLNDYNTETGNPAWNLPNVEGSLFLDYQIGEKWFLGSELFFVGEREDLYREAQQNVPPSEYPATLLTLDSYFDANAHLGYRVTDQLSLFVKGANLVNNQYQRWANYRVQSLQVLAGLSYRFDL